MKGREELTDAFRAAHIERYHVVIPEMDPEWAAEIAIAWLADRLGDEGMREAVEIAVRRAAHDVRRQDQSRNEARADAALDAVRQRLIGATP